MKRALAMFLSLSSAGLIGLSGCGEKKGTTGGTTDPNAKDPLIGMKDGSFKITGSGTTVYVDGKPVENSIGITRGKGFDQDVSIEFSGLPSGVKVEPEKPTLAKDAKEVKYNVTASDTAAVGEYPVKVTGKPTTGDVSIIEKLVVTVKPRASFTLDPPGNALWSAGVKQGETKNYTVAIGRDSEFTDEVTIKFDNLPKGVTIEPASPVIKSGQSEAKVVVKAEPDAVIGDSYKLKVTGHPSKGADVTREMSFKVSAK